MVESRGGAVLLESCGISIAFDLVLSQAPISRFRPSLRTERAGFPHSALQMDHTVRTRDTMLRLDVSTTEVYIPINILTSTSALLSPNNAVI